MRKITTLILDAGGVLVYPVHGQWTIPARYRELLGDHAADIPGEKWSAACKKHAHLLREDVVIDGPQAEMGKRLEFLIAMDQELGWHLPGTILGELAQDFTYNIDRYGWYDDVETLLPELKQDYRIGILSDTMPSLHLVVDAHPSRDCYDARVFSTEIGACKPDAKMYQEALRCLNAKPEECVFVDDREINLHGAMACGIHAVQMVRDDAACWNGPVVHDLTELKHYLEELQ